MQVRYRAALRPVHAEYSIGGFAHQFNADISQISIARFKCKLQDIGLLWYSCNSCCNNEQRFEFLTAVDEPQSIQLNTGTVVVNWKDGHRSIYSSRNLRLLCPCATCVDEISGEGRLDPKIVPQDLHAVDSLPVGNYGVQFLWSDAHYTGIYTHKRLREICPCEVCILDSNS